MLQAYIDGQADQNGGSITNIYNTEVIHFSDPDNGELFAPKPKEMDRLVLLILRVPPEGKPD